jgi:hypothetical protein
MSRCQSVKVMRFVHGSVKLICRVCCSAGYGAGSATSRSHYLDIVRTFVNQATHRPSDLSFPIRYFIAEMEMASGTGDRSAADLHSGPGNVAPGEPFLERKTHSVSRPMFPNGRYARIEMTLHIHRASKHHHLVRICKHLSVNAAIPSKAQVGVAIDHPWRNASVPKVDMMCTN